ncbi:MAG: arsenate reductase, partial [Flavobacteriaceae bacterium]
MHGISNCDTIKKAKKWLTDAGIEFSFRDYKKQP